MTIIDANIILRYILDDHPDLSAQATEIIEKQTVVLPLEAACEVVYVLQKVYTIDRKVIHQHLGNIIRENIIIVEKASVFLNLNYS